LGCGAGKALLAAALFFAFASCSGTELMGGLCAAATELAARWKDDLGPTLPGNKGEVPAAKTQTLMGEGGRTCITYAAAIFVLG
jgi:hypothetical protein